MKLLKSMVFFGLLMLLSVVVVSAQNGTCSAIVNEVLIRVEDICADIERNQACYGNSAVSVIERETIQFASAGDIANVSAIESLRLSPLDEDSEAWGVAVMRLQTNVPNTLPGQNVTFLLFGDVELTNAVAETNTTATSMQAFYLSTGVGSTNNCEEVPESGLLVQTPEGAGEIAFSVNGVDISLGSTAFLQAQPDGNMSISTLEGAAYASYGSEHYPIIAGTLLNIPLNAHLVPDGLPGLLQSYDLDFLDDLPIGLLDRDFDIKTPLTNEELDELFTLIENGIRVCGDNSFLPTCDHIPFRFGGEACWLNDAGNFDCEIGRNFFWGQDGFGGFDYQGLWDNFEFDYEAIGIDNILNEYGFESLEDLSEGFGEGFFDGLSTRELRALLNRLGFEPIDNLDLDLDLGNTNVDVDLGLGDPDINVNTEDGDIDLGIEGTNVGLEDTDVNVGLDLGDTGIEVDLDLGDDDIDLGLGILGFRFDLNLGNGD